MAVIVKDAVKQYGKEKAGSTHWIMQAWKYRQEMSV